MTMKISKVVMGKDVHGRLEADFVPHINSISKPAQDVLTKVRALREYTKETGFHTTKSQNDLIQSLNGSDLASVLLILKYSKGQIPAVCRRVAVADQQSKS